jgi:hypothetical protein
MPDVWSDAATAARAGRLDAGQAISSGHPNRPRRDYRHESLAPRVDIGAF